MGITGLLPFLDKASRRVHVSEFKGSKVAIDVYCKTRFIVLNVVFLYYRKKINFRLASQRSFWMC